MKKFNREASINELENRKKTLESDLLAMGDKAEHEAVLAEYKDILLRLKYQKEILAKGKLRALIDFGEDEEYQALIK